MLFKKLKLFLLPSISKTNVDDLARLKDSINTKKVELNSRVTKRLNRSVKRIQNKKPKIKKYIKPLARQEAGLKERLLKKESSFGKTPHDVKEEWMNNVKSFFEKRNSAIKSTFNLEDDINRYKDTLLEKCIDEKKWEDKKNICIKNTVQYLEKWERYIFNFFRDINNDLIKKAKDFCGFAPELSLSSKILNRKSFRQNLQNIRKSKSRKQLLAERAKKSAKHGLMYGLATAAFGAVTTFFSGGLAAVPFVMARFAGIGSAVELYKTSGDFMEQGLVNASVATITEEIRNGSESIKNNLEKQNKELKEYIPKALEEGLKRYKQKLKNERYQVAKEAEPFRRKLKVLLRAEQAFIYAQKLEDSDNPGEVKKQFQKRLEELEKLGVEIKKIPWWKNWKFITPVIFAIILLFILFLVSNQIF